MGRLANLRTVPFSKRKLGRGPLQRLSGSPRSLALGGLALGAVFSAGFFRRKRRRGEELMQFERPTPPRATPEAETGPIAAAAEAAPTSAAEAVEVPAAAPAEESGETATAINASAEAP